MEIELFQIDEVAELLGQFSCQNVKMSANIQRMFVGTYNSNSQLALECIVAEPELSQIHEVAELLGQFSSKK